MRFVKPHVEGTKHLLLAAAQAEVYETEEIEIGGGDVVGRPVVGCVYGKSEIHVIGEGPDYSGTEGGGVVPLKLTGVMVASESSGYSIFYGSGQSVWVNDLRAGNRLYQAPSPGGVQSSVLKRDGAVAWIAASPISTATGFHEEWVYALDSGAARLLAHGTAAGQGIHDIEPSSLALATNESTIYWMQSGQPHAAPLN
jgi:hypothetical protein